MITIKNTKEILTIRYPKSSDWKQLWTFINTMSKEKTYISYQGENISQQQEKKFIKQKLAAIRKHLSVQLLLINSKNAVVGSVNLDMCPRAEKHVGVIGISLLKDYRGRGLGYHLLNELLTTAKRTIPNLKIATLHCMSNNQIGLKLYKKIGFIEYGRLPNGICHNGTLVDNIEMYKSII